MSRTSRLSIHGPGVSTAMGAKKILGISALLVLVVGVTAALEPRMVSADNLENLIRRTSLFGVLSIGAAFVIVTGGIDLSIGSVVGLVGSLLPLWIEGRGWPAVPAVAAALALAVALGIGHGLLVTRVRLQPFVVTLCGLLVYRGVARWLTDDQTQGFGTGHQALRSLATAKPLALTSLAAIAGALLLVVCLAEWRRREGGRGPLLATALALLLLGLVGRFAGPTGLAEFEAPAPFLFLLVVTGAGAYLLNETIWGRHLLALGKNLEAARYSGIRTDRLVVASYAICSGLAGLGGVLFVLDQNSAQPASQGNFYELYAIAGAVLGGSSLRGGEASIVGVVIGTAVVRALYNAINLLGIPTQLEFAIIGAVILGGVVSDELVRRAVARRRAARAAQREPAGGSTP